MFDFIRDHQLNYMLCLSSICAVIILFISVTSSMPRKRKLSLIVTEKLDEYSIPESYSELYEKIRSAARRFDYDEILELLEK